MSVCSSCSATIRWAKTPAGKNTPLDDQPAADGPLYLDNGVARFVEDNTPLDVVRYNPHWATCPNADHHRRKNTATSWRSR